MDKTVRARKPVGMGLPSAPDQAAPDQAAPGQAAGESAADRRTRRSIRALFVRLFAINGTVFAIGTLVLALSPATVSSPPLLTEIPVLIVGLGVILAVNAALVKSSLNRMLDRLDAEHTASSAHTLAAQEGERQRIARELHDEIGQSLTVALLAMKRVVDRAPADSREDAETAQQAVRTSLEDVRQVAQRLRPGVLADLGLQSALASLSSEFSRSSGIPVTRTISPDLPALDGDVELVLYRVAQEGLTNVARHARASHVELSLGLVEGSLELRITDDGRGGPITEGAGVRGMRERASLIGARLTVAAAPGGGTEVLLVVPS
jgi:two-component system sensor histidine kinase UhpB